MAPDDDLYFDFVERCSSGEELEIPEGWSAELKERCRFFLDVIRGRSGGFARPSVVAVLESQSLEAGATRRPESGGGAPGLELSARLDRYVVEGEIASGGMGRILLCYDRDFRRRVAMKVIKRSTDPQAEHARFLEEAQATAQLEHPNIGPVYDLGLDGFGSPYFTMKWIRGRNLDDLLRDPKAELTLIRRLQILQQVAMGVDFAHSRGVVHRDLKPQNVMVGDFGEVLVVDWGLAKVLGRPESEAEGEDERDGAVTTSRAEEGVVSLRGTVKGSLPYMAPEQARGEVGSIDARTDVFGLGAILYVLLTGVAPHEGGTAGEVFARARRGEVVPPSRRAPERHVPAELDAIALKALARRREDRYASARDLHEALQRYVEGVHDRERRAKEAARLLAEAGRKRADLAAAATQESELRRRESELRAAVLSHDPVEKKRALWSAVEELRRASEAAARRFSDTVAAYHSVLSIEPQDPAAREALAELYFERLEDSERRGDRETSRIYEGLVRQWGVERFEVLLSGHEEVDLDSEPCGAEVLLSRYEPKGLELVESSAVACGATPLVCRLPRGSYLATLRKEGFSAARFPFLLERGRGVRARVRLRAEGAVPPGFVQVPGGLSIVGGDLRQGAARPFSRREVAEFFVARFPVTLGEYCDFLSERFASLPAGEDPSLLHKLLPAFETQQFVERGGDGRFRPHPRLGAEVPVMALFPAAMREYCEWAGRRLRLPLRLQSEDEWERVARGADGRLYPWGSEFDWGLCQGGLTVAGIPKPAPVGTFPTDVSPFGVRDLAGSIRELCEKAPEDPYHPVRGGSWYITIPSIFRSDTRTLLSAGAKTTDVGFRVAFTL
jgi:serine/threonine-protein kinase